MTIYETVIKYIIDTCLHLGKSLNCEIKHFNGNQQIGVSMVVGVCYVTNL